MITVTFDGWMDWDGDRHAGMPDAPEDAQAMLGHSFDPDDPEYEEHMFWAYVYNELESWDEWYYYWGAMADMHGIALG